VGSTLYERTRKEYFLITQQVGREKGNRERKALGETQQQTAQRTHWQQAV
jgi:hypothetical protein